MFKRKLTDNDALMALEGITDIIKYKIKNGQYWTCRKAVRKMIELGDAIFSSDSNEIKDCYIGCCKQIYHEVEYKGNLDIYDDVLYRLVVELYENTRR